MNDVFISYSSKDVETAKKIKRLLESPPRSVSCWMANDATITGGDDFRSRIAEAIRSCKVCLFVLSENSMKSDWCSRELSFAILENKPIYTVKIDDSTLDDIHTFKLSCSQIMDASVNFDAVAEALAINIKNGKDAEIEKAQRSIANSRRFGFLPYTIAVCIKRTAWILLFVHLANMISFIRANANSLSEFVTLSSRDGVDMQRFEFLCGILGAFIAFFVFVGTPLKILETTSLRKMVAASEMDSASALYSLYWIFTFVHPIFGLFSKKKSLERLERSAELGYAPAVKRLAKMKKDE